MKKVVVGLPPSGLLTSSGEVGFLDRVRILAPIRALMKYPRRLQCVRSFGNSKKRSTPEAYTLPRNRPSF